MRLSRRPEGDVDAKPEFFSLRLAIVLDYLPESAFQRVQKRRGQVLRNRDGGVPFCRSKDVCGWQSFELWLNRIEFFDLLPLGKSNCCDQFAKAVAPTSMTRFSAGGRS